jgi:hypothetical protein
VLFPIIYLSEKTIYHTITREDGLIEWLTFVGLFGASIYSLMAAVSIKKKHNYVHWFFFLFFAFNLLAGLEEISWGQRVFGIESNEFFQKYNDQQETNLHNTFQGIVGIKTRHVAMFVLFIYGVALPYLLQKNKLNLSLIHNKTLIIPPYFLIPAYCISCVLMLDKPTGREEEIGECFFGLCFFIMAAYNYHLVKTGAFDKTKASRKAKRVGTVREVNHTTDANKTVH